MGKRSDFERLPRDYYITPQAAAKPLLDYMDKHEPKGIEYCEPCAGDGTLVKWLSANHYICKAMFDIEPNSPYIGQKNMFDITQKDLNGANYVITNPPWDRKILHPMINHFLSMGVSVWLLFDADWMHTKQSKGFMEYCETIISVGRVKWFPDSKMTGKDNCAWYKFVPEPVEQTKFIGR